ncbi:MAG: hypothetical protein AAF936_06305 [Pseudomonadota bacterium]
MNKFLIASAAGLGLSMIAAGAYAGQGKGGKRWDRLDINGDGKITAEELSERQSELIANADTDGDGAITKDEMKAYHEARRAEWREKNNPDTNGDGVIDRTEFIASAQERFDRMDKNGDGVISEDERPRRGRGRHRGGE